MILSGWNSSAMARAYRRITRIGMFAPKYMRFGGKGNGLGGFLAIASLYPKAGRACQTPGAAEKSPRIIAVPPRAKYIQPASPPPPPTCLATLRRDFPMRSVLPPTPRPRSLPPAAPPLVVAAVPRADDPQPP